jgi:RIO-like serine/threonine protein kinase
MRRKLKIKINKEIRMEYIASGLQADVYLENGKAIKLYKRSSRMTVEYEFNLQKMAYESGLPVPKVYDIINIGNKYGIIMDYIIGKTVGDIMLSANAKIPEYMKISIEMQNKVNNICGKDFPPMKTRLENDIKNAIGINDTTKNNILNKLYGIEFRNNLCHGDFHVMNLIETNNGIKIIDWVDATCGIIEADIYKSYMLYKLSKPEIAELYLDMYCKIMNKEKNSILEWASVIACARLALATNDGNIVKSLIKIIEENA